MILCVCPNPSIDTYSWIDQISPGEINRIQKQKEFPGGKGVHVAFAISEIGEPSAVMGFWAGATGSWIKEKCFNEGIICYGPAIKGSNRKCYTFRSVLQGQKWNNTELLESGPEIETEDFKLFKEEFLKLSQMADLICLSGSWPIQSPPSAYKELILIAKNSNKRVILDASGIQLEYAIKALPYGLHLNLEEAKELCKSDDIKTIFKYLSNYVELVALTMGKDGLYLKYKNRLIHANVHIEHVFSAVGSGDCLTAGIAYAVNKNMNLEDIAKWGVACGAANCLREDLGMLYKKDVDHLSGQVKIQEIVL